MTGKAIGMMGTRGYVDGVSFKTTTEAMQSVGNNTGNLVFQYACYNLVDEPKLFIGQDIPWDIAKIRQSCRAIVIPSANFVREKLDFTGFVDFLEKTELPLIFLGIGAQAPDFRQRSFDLHPSIHRLIALIKERSPKVAVRGRYTQEVLDSFGVSHTVVTGCPSNFINPSDDLPDVIAHKLEGELQTFITHGDEPWPKDRTKQLVERRLATWTQQGAAMQSQQSVPVFMTFIRRNNPYARELPGDHLQESLRKALMPEATPEQFLDYLAAKLRVYFSVPQWLEDSSKYDFSVGLRLHGNMVAWQAGTPALWIHHDSRTRELAEVMAVPSLDVATFLEKCETVAEAWKRTEFQPDIYRARRTQLRRRLDEVLTAGGIKIRGAAGRPDAAGVGSS